MLFEESVDVGEQGFRHEECNIVGCALRSSAKSRANPSLSVLSDVWDTTYMADDDRSPLQIALANAIAASNRTRDSFDSDLQKILGTTGKPLWDVERGKVKRPSPKVLRAMETVLAFPDETLVEMVHPREGGSPPVKIEQPRQGAPRQRPEQSDQPRMKSVDSGETAPVTRLDLSYSMGPGADLDSSYVDGEAFEFDIGFLRSMTVTPPDRIRIVDGIGDSMQPTLHDRDLLFIDVNQRDLNAQDRIWAIWLFGLGAVKRLRAVGPDRVLVISDNPDVDNQEVSRTDILIHGRVIGSIKRH